MVSATARLDDLLERARATLLLGYEACRRAHASGAGLDQEVVVTSQRTLDELDDIIDEIRDLLGAGARRGPLA